MNRFTKKCPYCAALLTVDAKICWSCRKGLVSHQLTQTNKAVLPQLSCLILIVVCMVVIRSLLTPEGEETGNSFPLIGETGKIHNGSGRILVARDLVSLYELVNGSNANDSDKMSELLGNGRVFWVDSNTPVKVIGKSANFGSQVLILNGKLSGQTCWLPSNWVVKP